jgi:plasmid stabilization system protein ParE
VPTVVYAPRVLEDFERIVEHLRAHEVPDAEARVDGILQAVALLESSPDIGRPVGDGVRELVIGRGSNGYVARYRHLDALDTVVVLAVRAQRERPFDRPR